VSSLFGRAAMSTTVA